jgi:hypothetical protein
MSVTERIDHARDRAIERLESAQDATLGAAKSVVKTVKPYVPHLQLAQVSSRLPEPATVVGRAYDFAGRVLSTNRGFAEELARTLAPLAPFERTNGAQKQQKSSAKAATKRTQDELD